jgi:hypothetical protein
MRVPIHHGANRQLRLLVRMRLSVGPDAPTRVSIWRAPHPHRQVPVLDPRDLIRRAVEEAVEAAASRVSSQRRDRATTRLVQMRRDFALVVDLDLDVHFAEHAPEALHNVLAMPPIFLHAEQKAMQHRIVAGEESLLGENLFVGFEERTGRGRVAVDLRAMRLQPSSSQPGILRAPYDLIKVLNN